MGWLKYDRKETMAENLDQHKSTFEKLEKLNREFGVSGNYQNHSGGVVGAPVWDLHHLLKVLDPEFFGVQYDIRHATVEGGFSWPLGMKLLASWIQTVDIKDFIWFKNEEGQWRVKNVPWVKGWSTLKSSLNCTSHSISRHRFPSITNTIWGERNTETAIRPWDWM
jgi:hypothetical protein